MSLFDYDPYETDPSGYDARPISFSEAREFIVLHHYMMRIYSGTSWHDRYG